MPNEEDLSLSAVFSDVAPLEPLPIEIQGLQPTYIAYIFINNFFQEIILQVLQPVIVVMAQQ